MEYENSIINDSWLKGMKEIYKRYENFDEIETNNILCIIFFISKRNEIEEIVKKKYKIVNNTVDIDEINNIVEEYTNEYRIMDIFQSYVPYNHEEMEKKLFDKKPLVIKNVTNKDNIYYPNTTRYLKRMSNLIIFCKENTSMSLFTKRIRIKDSKKTRKNKKIYNIF
uniref:Uncharacterized protein n=1 Tax=viral metagenome TaxID=1070528 RepID=A0A6C0AWV5_9ZZZZ|tara:strand:+ start:3037 stop:3537 length:501 start_codon:yes stop_codon:yes gene_type:complete